MTKPKTDKPQSVRAMPAGFAGYWRKRGVGRTAEARQRPVPPKK